jgi:integrase
MIKSIYSRKHGKKVYRVDVRVNRKRVRATLFTKSDAEQVEYKLKHDASLKKFGIKSVGQCPALSDLFARRCAVIDNRRERTRARRVLTYLENLLPHGIAIDQVTTSDLQLFVERRKADGLSDSSVTRELNIISAALRQSKNFYPQMEQWKAPRTPTLKDRNMRRERYILRDERKKIVEYLMAPQVVGEDPRATSARHRTGLIFRFALASAMRHGEIDKLMWAHVGKERIKVFGTKTNKTRYVPVTPVIAEILAARRVVTKSGYVFTAGGGTPPHFYRILADACKSVGVPYGNERNGIRMHDCRHTATTDLLQAGIDLSTVQAITGHSNKVMILYYSHPTGESLERAAKVLNTVADLKAA